MVESRVKEIDILVSSKDRATEILCLMQALRTQTFQNWNLYILDNGYGTPLMSFHFINVMINRLQLEGHKVKIFRNDKDFGICYARNLLNEIQIKEGTANYCLRIDDDTIPQPDFLQKLIDVINSGYDIASGLIPPLAMPEMKREIRFLNGEINKVRLNEQGDLIKFGDDCGMCYIEQQIIPAGHFRSFALYPSEINKKIKYEPNLSNYGFREESFFSLRCRMEGYKIGVHTGAICYHILTPSGGGKTTVSPENMQLDDETFRKWIKQKYLAGELRV